MNEHLWGWQPVVHPDDLPECLNRWKRSIATGESYEAEMQIRQNQGSEYRWHLVRGLPVRRDNGDVLRWVGATIDLHDQRSACGAGVVSGAAGGGRATGHEGFAAILRFA